MNILFYLISVLVTFSVIGCATPVIKSGTDFKKETLNNIVIGQTTKVEVIGVLGAPGGMRKRILNNAEYDISIYAFSQLEEGLMNYKRLFCEFKNNLLNAYDFESTFKEDQPRITEKEKIYLERGKTRRNDVQNLFGTPTSKAFLPTTLISDYVPSGTKEIWKYSHREIEMTIGRTTNIDKYLIKSIIIFFDGDGIVIDSSYFEDVSKGATY